MEQTNRIEQPPTKEQTWDDVLMLAARLFGKAGEYREEAESCQESGYYDDAWERERAALALCVVASRHFKTKKAYRSAVALIDFYNDEFVTDGQRVLNSYCSVGENLTLKVTATEVLERANREFGDLERLSID